ncbi:hypothetical protein THAOC_23800, partial [Thalassiosira oceanica]
MPPQHDADESDGRPVDSADDEVIRNLSAVVSLPPPARRRRRHRRPLVRHEPHVHRVRAVGRGARPRPGRGALPPAVRPGDARRRRRRGDQQAGLDAPVPPVLEPPHEDAAAEGEPASRPVVAGGRRPGCERGP